jgi:hypothetical protein
MILNKICFYFQRIQKEISRLWKHPSIRNHLNKLQDKLGLLTNGLKTLTICIQSHMYLCRDMGKIFSRFVFLFQFVLNRSKTEMDGGRSTKFFSKFFISHCWQSSAMSANIHLQNSWLQKSIRI